MFDICIVVCERESWDDQKERLEQGIAALKAGQKARARFLLGKVTQRDRQNEMAWLWLSGAVDTDEERCDCPRECSSNQSSK